MAKATPKLKSGINVLITSGSVTDSGKTTISKHLKSYLGDVGTKHVGIETMAKRQDGEDVRVPIEENTIRDLYFDIANPSQNVIIDVGGEHFAALMDQLGTFGGRVQSRIDYYICPVTMEVKAENVCLGIDSLIEAGVPADRIYVVFNKILPSKAGKLRDVFATVYEHAASVGAHVADESILYHKTIEDYRGRQSMYAISDKAGEIEQSMDEAFAKGDTEAAKSLTQLSLDASAAVMCVQAYNTVFERIFGTK